MLTGPQRLALRVLADAGKDGAEGSRDASRSSPAPWMRDAVNTRAANLLVKYGLAREWSALPDGTVVTGANLVHLIGRYRSRYGITARGLRMFRAFEVRP